MVYVDDLLVLSPSEDAIQQFKSAISKHFDTSDKGKLQRYLAINVHYANGIIHLSQADYVEKILVRFGLENRRTFSSPERVFRYLTGTKLLTISFHPACKMQLKPIPIYADNYGAIASSNPEFHAATKHIAIRFHRLREEVAAGNVKFVKIPTADMAADGLTKPLGKTLFKRWIIQMGLTVYKTR
ncbi:hypothetical protein PDIDSM_3459 [Penicillium digitatum]|nr:hypothetical protein PDIDSM_3459 [Penicillium digitatum]